jgi:hypothetical protein
MRDAYTAQRRLLLKTLASVAASIGVLPAALAEERSSSDAASDGDPPTIPPGKPGDFDFLTGEWKIHHRQRQADTGAWLEFDGEATCWSLLGGIAHVEELRIPARDFSGMGLRLLDRKTHVWSDYWVNGKAGTLGAPGLTGGFVDGRGIFESRDQEDGKPVVYRGVWDRIDKGKSHRWYQAASRDDGKSWDISWEMDWRRA